MKDDLDRIMEVMQAAFDPAYGEAWSRRQVEDALALPGYAYRLIAPSGVEPEPGEDAAGFSLSRQVAGEEELLLFAISPAFRRKGLGMRLLAQFAHEAASRGADRLFLEMRRGNPAEQLYRNFGFEPIGIRPNYYSGRAGQRFDAVTFACAMDGAGLPAGIDD